MRTNELAAGLLAFPLLIFSTGCTKGSVNSAAATRPESAVAAPDSTPPAHFRPFTLKAGTDVGVTLLEVFDPASANLNTYLPMTIAEDVKGADGEVAIPAGSRALAVPQSVSQRNLVSGVSLALFSVTIGGHHCRLGDGGRNVATADITDDAAQGAEHRGIHLNGDTYLVFRIQSDIGCK